VPSPRAFFGSDAAHAALAALLRAEAAGERALLLMGNQGVGKNVCAELPRTLTPALTLTLTLTLARSALTCYEP